MTPGTALRTALAVALPCLLVACGSDEGSDAPPSSSTSAASSPSPSDPAEVGDVTEVARDLEVPWDLAFLPDDSALVTLRDRAEIVRIVDGSVRSVGTVPGVAPGGEGGLLGLAVSPDFTEDETIYAYLTSTDDNRVVRMTLRDNALGDPEPVLTGIPAAGNHNGGRIAFGPDGQLYVATGDAGDTSSAQDLDSLGGKILRITPDGGPAPGNPDADSPVWSSGHRNVQGLAWGEDETMWASEFGQDTWDELNRVRRGDDHGWPEVEGVGQREPFVDPVATWSTVDASPSGITVDGDGAIIIAALRGESLWRVPVTGAADRLRVGTPERLLEGEHGRLRDVELAPDGSLWVLTNNTFRGDPRDGDDRVLRVTLR